MLEFPFPDPQGGERRTKLTRFQGVGTPDKPLLTLTWSDHERAYKKLAEWLQTLAGTATKAAMTQHDNLAPAASIPNLGPQVLPDTESYAYELTVHLERQCNNLNVRYYLPSGAAVGSLTHAWDTVRKTLEPIHALLDGIDRAALHRLIEQAPTECGPAFFALLFGLEPAWEPILRTLFGQPPPAPRPNPIRAPVRLHICTDEPLLLGLPWRLTAWQGYLLGEHDWELTTSNVIQPAEDCTTTAPCNVLIVAPQLAIDPPDSRTGASPGSARCITKGLAYRT